MAIVDESTARTYWPNCDPIGRRLSMRSTGGQLIATHIPIELTKNSDGHFVLEGHVARANPQWKSLEKTDAVLTIISGAHAYISPRWYDEPHSTVTTWSYMIVHVYGKPRLITDAAELGEHLVKMVERYEHETSYDLARVPVVATEKLMRGAVGFKDLSFTL